MKLNRRNAISSLLFLGALACERPSKEPGSVQALGFADAIQIVQTLSLEEDSEVVNVNIDVAVDGSSGFVVADRAEGQVRLYDQTGRLAWVGGGKGGGPGEFSSLVLARRLPDGSLLCANRSASLTIFDTQKDSVLRTIPTRFSHVEDMDVMDDETVIITALLDGNRFGSRIHVWDLREDRVIWSFFSPFERAQNRPAATIAGWTKVSRRGDSLAVVFATSDTVYFYSRDGSEGRKIPLPSGLFRRVPQEEPRRSLSARERVEWLSTFDFVTDVWWLSSGNLLVQYQDVPPGLTLNDRRWHLLVMESTGKLLAEVRNTPRAFLVDEVSGLIVFQDPDSMVPSKRAIRLTPVGTTYRGGQFSRVALTAGTAAGPLGKARGGRVRNLACLFEQAVEQEPPGSGSSPVESEGELVQIVRELRDCHCPLVGSEKPALHE